MVEVPAELKNRWHDLVSFGIDLPEHYLTELLNSPGILSYITEWNVSPESASIKLELSDNDTPLVYGQLVLKSQGANYLVDMWCLRRLGRCDIKNVAVAAPGEGDIGLEEAYRRAVRLFYAVHVGNSGEEMAALVKGGEA